MSSDKRAIDLDTLEAEEGYIVTGQTIISCFFRIIKFVFTGVRFKLIGSHLNFEIFTTKFDFDAGKLVNPNVTSKWVDNPNTDVSLKNPRYV